MQNTLVGHSCGTPLWDTSVGHFCGTPLWDTFVRQCCGTPLWGTLVGHFSGRPLWGNVVGQFCGIPLCDTLVRHFCGTLLWDYCFSLSIFPRSKLELFLQFSHLFFKKEPFATAQQVVDVTTYKTTQFVTLTKFPTTWFQLTTNPSHLF